ncbi:MAG TPA: FecR domain-containing protein [Planctomicrobium sp.]|nr:FecR domain-containing protein [Planctomicrobium sp.]
MGADPSPMNEVRQLVDRLYNGQIETSELERMASLVAEDQRCLQAYIEQLDFHCALVDQADLRSSMEAVLSSLQQSETRRIPPERSRQHGLATAVFAGTVLLTAMIGAIYYSAILVPGQIATVASLSADLETGPTSLELMQILRKGETISVTRGMLCLQLPDVTVDLIAPVSVRLERKDRVFLSNGMAVVKVQPDGVGFTVKTPDAEVIDLGTEFLVQHDRAEGTHVSVRRGAAQAKLLDWRGLPTKTVELTAAQAAQLQQSTEQVREAEYASERYLPVDRSRGGIRRITGGLRMVSEVPVTFQSNQTTTPNHMLVIPERQRVVLESPLTVEGVSGRTTIPAGTTVSSYLIHYDPTLAAHSAPRGSVTFWSEIAAVIGSASGLKNTDPLFGLPETAYETGVSRELESEKDEVHFSDDRKTVSFFFGVSYPEFLDEARILVIEESP